MPLARRAPNSARSDQSPAQNLRANMAAVRVIVHLAGDDGSP